MEKTVSAVLVAAGSSTRMGFDKLSFDLGNETVLHRSIRAFAQCPQVTELVLVAGKNREFVAQQAADCPKPVQIVAGGATRAESAKNGVLAAHGELVAVHDAARPFVSAAVITAALLLIQRFAKGVRWFDQQEKQTTDIAALKAKHEADMKALKQALTEDMRGINEEQTLLTYGVLACLKGLKEQGCNGPVSEAINKIEKFLNKKAHGD